MRVWDVRTGKDVKVIKAHSNEILSFDFNKYDNLIASGSTDNTIRIWVGFPSRLLSLTPCQDLRSKMNEPLAVLSRHQLAVRRVKFSPYHSNVLASASYLSLIHI